MITITPIALVEYSDTQKVLVDVTTLEGIHHWHGNTPKGLRGQELQDYLDSVKDQWYADIQVRCQHDGVTLVDTHAGQMSDPALIIL